MHCIVLNVRSRSFAKQKLQPVGTLGESSDRRDMEQIIERIELRSMLLGFPMEPFCWRFPSETPGFHFVKLAIEILLRKTLSPRDFTS